MSYSTLSTFALMGMTGLVLGLLVSRHRADSARAIAIHIVCNTIPMLERHGFVMVRKQVSFGNSPYVKLHMASPQGLWIDIGASRDSAYFRLQSDNGEAGPPHSFEVSGPWDELTETNLSGWERNFQQWKANGCRFLSMADQPQDFVTYYQPMYCTYDRQGHEYAASPTDPGDKLRRWFDQAQPHERYPLVPKLPSA